MGLSNRIKQQHPCKNHQPNNFKQALFSKTIVTLPKEFLRPMCHFRLLYMVAVPKKTQLLSSVTRPVFDTVCALGKTISSAPL